MTQLEIRTTDGEMNMTLEEIVSAVASLKVLLASPSAISQNGRILCNTYKLFNTIQATTLSMVYAHYKDLTSIPQNRMDPQNEICHLWDCLESLSSANGVRVFCICIHVHSYHTILFLGIYKGTEKSIRLESPPGRPANSL